mmetsp:Transcript_12818/g.54998  ORF Transcript_12818/g.54998 Transcript_12818/m.54998 type:complete len:208 (+) Transcript_12818:22-645(+)
MLLTMVTHSVSGGNFFPAARSFRLTFFAFFVPAPPPGATGRFADAGSGATSVHGAGASASSISTSSSSSSSPSPSSFPPVSRRHRSSLNAATSWYPWPVSGSLYLAGLPVTAHVAGRGARGAPAPNGGGVDAPNLSSIVVLDSRPPLSAASAATLLTRRHGCVCVFLTRSAFFFVASSMFSRCSRSLRLRTSVSAASARISAWVMGL